MNLDELERQVLGAVRRDMTPDDEAVARIRSGARARISIAPRESAPRPAILPKTRADGGERPGSSVRESPSELAGCSNCRIANGHKEAKELWPKAGGAKSRLSRMVVSSGSFAAAFALAIGIGGVGFAAVWVSRTVVAARPAVRVAPAISSGQGAPAPSHKRPRPNTAPVALTDPADLEEEPSLPTSPSMANELGTESRPMLAVPAATTPSANAQSAATAGQLSVHAPAFPAESRSTSYGATSTGAERTWLREHRSAGAMLAERSSAGAHRSESGERLPGQLAPGAESRLTQPAPLATAAPSPNAAKSTKPAPRSDQGPAVTPPESPQPDWALEEVRLVREADLALRRGNPGTALRLLNELTSTVPRGRLGEEREAVRVLATCASAPGALAQNDAVSFLRLHTASMYAGRIAETCKLDSDRDDGAR